MSMGHSAAYDDVIEAATIEKFCKKEFKTFQECIKRLDVDMEEFARDVSYGDLKGESGGEPLYKKELVKAYESLCEAFAKRTGLTISIAYHSSDDGDVYDEVNGIYWGIYGMYQLTKAGKKMEKYVDRKFFVNFG